MESAEDGGPIRPGCVLVAPPGQHTLITKDETVALIPSGSVPPYRPSADLLLTTLALAAGPRVIAVVLTGGDSDGSLGVQAVKQAGGQVIAQDVETSKVPSMPLAAMQTGVVDLVLPLDEIAPALKRMVVDAGDELPPTHEPA